MKRMKRSLGIAAIATAVATLGFAGTASAQSAAVTLNPNSLNFGTQTVGTTSAPQSVSLGVPCLFVLDLGQWGGKSCTAPGKIEEIAATGDFSQINNCPLPISNGAVDGTVVNCVITVAFTPSATGERTGKVTMKSYGAADAYTVPLTGTGVQQSSGGGTGQPGSSNAGNGSKGSGSGSSAGVTAKKCKKSKKAASAKKKCKKRK